ncbi:MAG: TrkH family potassium uptake protein [Bacillota bacterium]
MIRRPSTHDYRTIAHYTGKVMIGIAILFSLPLATALVFQEWNTALDFANSLCIALLVGMGLSLIPPRARSFTWLHGMVVASLSWMLATVLGALPYYFSGHYRSFLDAAFDVMSGYTTTGLILIQDLDHVANGLNMWRHVLTYVGGQGMVVLALTFLVKEAGGGVKMYIGEAKDERLLPSVVHTARAIWWISLVYLAVGTMAHWVAGLLIGLKPIPAFLHGLWVYMAGWSTGGFAPSSMNVMYYHSTLYETVTALFFVLGSFNFALHWAVWNGKRREVYRNIENLSLTATLTLTFTLAAVGLIKAGVYTEPLAVFRRVFYMIISGHTTTGFQNLYARQLLLEWGPLPITAITIAMLIGASACSTAGGFKGLRVGILVKAIIQDTRRLLVPESAVVVEKFHHIRDVVLEDRHVRGAALVVVSYVALFGIGVVLTALSGASMPEAAFETASVTGNVGLSIGVTNPQMPAYLKLWYIVSMWIARLEFFSVYALIGFIFAGVRRK